MSASSTGLAERMTAIADAIEGRDADDAVSQRIAQALAAAGREQERLRTVLETWQQVWPRLGRQPEFRGAVVREARRWAEQLAGTRS